jgi:hypothetical protein
LPVLTGIVSVTAASFVLGPTSVPCLLISLRQATLANSKLDSSNYDQNMTSLPPIEDSKELFWFGLSFLTKAIDSFASGFVYILLSLKLI